MIFSARIRRSRHSGTVLVMTLVAMAVMLILLLALMNGVSSQMRGAQGDASLAREKLLADSAAQLVIGQIEQGSSQTNQAWISQPGLLRTYNTNSVRTPTACYKLYSTSSLDGMVDASGNLNFLASDIPANWNSTPSQYTDLNAPATTPGLFGQTIYPILESGDGHRRGEQRHRRGDDAGRVAVSVAGWNARPGERRHGGQSDRGAHRFLDR
jgi:type II secretory pathway pseudopilin PulG